MVQVSTRVDVSFIDVEVKKKYSQCKMRNGGDISPWNEGMICGRWYKPYIRGADHIGLTSQGMKEKSKVLKKVQYQIVPRTDGSRTVILRMWSFGQDSASQNKYICVIFLRHPDYRIININHPGDFNFTQVQTASLMKISTQKDTMKIINMPTKTWKTYLDGRFM